MSEKPQYPPVKSPMMVDGQISAPWARYFQHVVTPYFERLLNLEDMEILDWSNNRQKDHQRRIEDIERLIHEVWKTDDKGFTKRIENIENTLQFVDGPKDASLLRRLDDFEILIYAALIPHTQNTDTALGAVGTKNPPIDADLVLYRDSTAANVLVTSTWTQIKAFLKTYFDTLYNKYVHLNHSGEVTSVADGAQTIAADAVTYAKMQNVSATDKILGRATAGAGDVEEIACTTAGRALIDDATAAAQALTLGLGATDGPTLDHIHLTSGQIVFPAAAVPSAGPNTLDDYEEGTWTPVVRGAGTAGTYELATAIGSYTKIGRLVTIQAFIILAGAITGGGTGPLNITGVPFAKANNSLYMVGSMATHNIDLTAGTITIVPIFASSAASSTLATLETHDNAGLTNTPISGVSADDIIELFITYEE